MRCPRGRRKLLVNLYKAKEPPSLDIISNYSPGKVSVLKSCITVIGQKQSQTKVIVKRLDLLGCPARCSKGRWVL